MPIKDNRTIVDAANSTSTLSSTPPAWHFDGGGGGFGLLLDTTTGYDGVPEGTPFVRRSIGAPISTTSAFVYYETSAAQDLSSSEVYILFQVGLIGDLEPKSINGFNIRLETSTNNYREYFIGDGTTWPAASVGSAWYLGVVDPNRTPAEDPTNISDTGTFNPASVLRIGFTSQQQSMSKAENNWIDAIYTRPYTDPALIIEGTNAGSPYTWDDVIDYCDTNGIPIVTRGPGGSVVLAGPIQIGNTTSGHQHLFTDTSKTLLWAEQPFANNDTYKITIEGNAGSNTIVNAGIVSGTGADRVGTQGWTIQAAATLANGSPNLSRWSLQANSTVSDTTLAGSVFNHYGNINVEASTTDAISNFFIDGNKIIEETSAGGSGTFLKNTILSSNTAINIAALETLDLTGIQQCTFIFNDTTGRGGHAIQVSAGNPATMTLDQTSFSGYSGTTNNPNTAIDFANTAGGVVVSLTTGTSEPSYKTDGISVTFAASVTGTISNLLEKTEVRVYDLDDEDPNIPGCYTEIAGIENADVGDVGDNFSGSLASQSGPDSNGRYTITFTVGLNKNLRIKFINSDFVDNNYWIADNVEISSGTDNFSIQAAQRVDRVFANPS